MLEIKQLRSGYGDREVLHGVDLTVPAGRITAIVGPNGCGKSTLLKTIAGILRTAQGQILLDGCVLDPLDPRAMARKIAYLPQSRQIPEITVERLVLHGRFPYLSFPRRYRKEDIRIVEKAMAAMGITGLAQRELGTLSGGQRQKVYIAMALAQDTPVVLLDEPTTFLDIAHQMQLMQQARFLADAGKTVVLVIHDLAMALRGADHLVVMASGSVLTQGSPEQVFETGCLDEAFRIRVNRTRTPEGWQYYYQERGECDGVFSALCGPEGENGPVGGPWSTDR